MMAFNWTLAYTLHASALIVCHFVAGNANKVYSRTRNQRPGPNNPQLFEDTSFPQQQFYGGYPSTGKKCYSLHSILVVEKYLLVALYVCAFVVETGCLVKHCHSMICSHLRSRAY